MNAATYYKEKAERLATEVERLAGQRELLHDCLMFLESADWRLGISRKRLPWDQGLLDLIATLRKHEED